MATRTSNVSLAAINFLLFAFASAASNEESLQQMLAKGALIASQDPLAAELRNRHPAGPARQGFDIGMAAAEGQTLPGPGKQALHESLILTQRAGFSEAVLFSLQRNKNAEVAAKGATIATTDQRLMAARSAGPDAFYRLGFDISTGIFGNRAQGGLGNTATGPGSIGIRDSLNPEGQSGFNAALQLLLPGVAIPVSLGDKFRVPDVVGFTGDAAYWTVSRAGFYANIAYENKPDSRPCLVKSTVPSAGTELPRESTVVVRIPCAPIDSGRGHLAGGQGFDLDTGRFEEKYRGADMFLGSFDQERKIDSNGNVYYTPGGVVANSSDGAVFGTYVGVSSLEGHTYGEKPFAQTGLELGFGSYPYQYNCEYTLDKPEWVGSVFSLDHRQDNLLCVITSHGKLAVVQFTSGSPDYQFRWVLYPRFMPPRPPGDPLELKRRR